MAEKWTLHFISCTHWDREWYMTEGRFRRRLVRLFDRLIALMERDPSFGPFLLDGQFLAMRDWLEIRPEMRERAARLVREGRIQVGPWYTQPICSMSSGEALIRNLLLGTKLGGQMGRTLRVGWMVDEFGHAACVPLLLNGFGIEDMAAWRGMPRGARAMFRWEGADGAAVNVFYTNNGYGNATAMPLEPGELMERVDRLIEGRREKAESPHLLMLNGVDHAFAQENLPEIIKRINTLRADAEAVFSSIENYIACVKRWHEEHGVQVQTVCGELQDPSESDVLPDSHSTRPRLKMANFAAESLMGKWAEPFAALAYACGGEYPDAELWRAWELLLQNHAHDSIACSSVDGVERQAVDRFERCMDIAQDIADEALAFIARKTAPGAGRKLAVFNPLSHMRGGVVDAVIDIPEGDFVPFFSDGARELPLTVRFRRRTRAARYDPFRGHITFVPVTRYDVSFGITGVPPMGYKAVEVRRGEGPACAAGTLFTARNTVENEYIRLCIEPGGTFSLTDKRTGKTFSGLNGFEDGGDAGHGYAYIQPAIDRVVTQAELVSVEIAEDSPLLAKIVIKFLMRLPASLDAERRMRSKKLVECPIRTAIAVRAGSPAVEVETTILNRAEDHRLRACFPTGLDTDRSCAGQPFAVETRPVALPDLDDYPKEKPRPTHPMQGWCSVSGGNAGLMAAAAGIYEYEVSDDPTRTLKLTLLRCVGRIDGDALGFVEDKLIPGAQCLGETAFRYCLVPHDGSWERALPSALEFLHPMRAVLRDALEDEAMPWYTPPAEELPDAQPFVEARPACVQVSAVKKCEDRESLAVRIYNPCGGHAAVKVNLPFQKPEKAWLLRLDETRVREIAIGADGWMELPDSCVNTVEIPLIEMKGK